MGLKAIQGIRQYISFDPQGRVQRMYEVTFTTEKTPGEFTFDVKAEEFDPDAVRKLAAVKAEEIDKAIG